VKESLSKERVSLIEKEIAGLADKLDELGKIESSMDDIQKEIKALKVFLSRAYPEFKKQFPEIIKKVRG